jgi:hypothetical protein
MYNLSLAEKHWHGAAPSTTITHIAIVEELDGKSTDWREKVSDEQYAGRSQAWVKSLQQHRG